MFGKEEIVTQSQLRWFGLSLAMLLWLVAFGLYWRFRMPWLAVLVMLGGCGLLAVYSLQPQSRRPIILGFRRLVWPIQVVVSTLLLAILFFMVITPIGVAMRLFGRDPLAKSHDRQRESYWEEYPSSRETDRYFRMY